MPNRLRFMQIGVAVNISGTQPPQTEGELEREIALRICELTDGYNPEVITRRRLSFKSVANNPGGHAL